MRIIQANVSKRLLTKASRLFTGTLQGRIIEILQNARRAGATKVQIINTPSPALGGSAAGAGGNPAQARAEDRATVVVRDNGSGVEDFAKLLDLGASGWAEEGTLEQSEDPAGVGLFCLAPRGR